jgi:predicted nucleotidyltransferase
MLLADREPELRAVLARHKQLDFAVLVGSRASGRDHARSDWDIAVRWAYELDLWTVLGLTETLRHQLAQALGVTPDQVDLIDLRQANLAMRATVAQDGKVLFGVESLAWRHFLQRTWRELEDWEWEQRHA